MPYKKQTFVNGETRLRAEHLEYIEDGIIRAFAELPKYIPDPPNAAPGKYIMITEVDELGRVIGTTAADAPTLPSGEEVAF